jgi:hypothetical protein
LKTSGEKGREEKEDYRRIRRDGKWGSISLML